MAQEETNFKRWRIQCKLTQKQASEALGISKSQVEFYDSGVSRSSKKAVSPSLAERTLMAVIVLGATISPWPE